jgi:citrate synthase
MGTGRLVRPAARYVGPPSRSPQDVAGWTEAIHESAPTA